MLAFIYGFVISAISIIGRRAISVSGAVEIGEIGGDEMVWYLLFSLIVVLIIAVVADAENWNPGLLWIAGFIAGSLFVVGLVVQYGVVK